MSARWGGPYRLRTDWRKRLAVYLAVTLAGIVLGLVMAHVPDAPNYYRGDTIVCGKGEWLNAEGDGCEAVPNPFHD